jgi:hypothetical protein
VVTKNWEPLLWCVSYRHYTRHLGDVRVGASVGHGQEEGTVVLELEVLVGELLTID